MAVSAVAFGLLLAHFSEVRLIQVVQGAAVVTMVLNCVALWKQEPRDTELIADGHRRPAFFDAWTNFDCRAHPRGV